MRKSLVNWIRNIVLVTAASTGSITFASSKAYAHDLPIFDMHSSIGCFGIGSCGFPLETEVANPSDLEDPSRSVPHQSSTFDQCFGDLQSQPWSVNSDWSAASYPEKMLPLAELANTNDCQELDARPQTLVTADANLSYPTSFLSMIQAAGIRIPNLDMSQITQLFPIAEFGSINVKEEDVERHPAIVENYLGKRALVDDYLATESFVRDWRSTQSYRGLNRFDHSVREADESALAMAVPDSLQLNFYSRLVDTLAIVEDVQCRAAQELRDFVWTQKLSQSFGSWIATSASESLANHGDLLAMHEQNYIEEMLAHSNQLSGLPAFVIQQLDGKDFLLPTNQYKLWNDVPELSAKVSELKISGRADLPMMKDFAISVSSGLDLIAGQLQVIAKKLRVIAQDGSQVANRSMESVH